VNKRAKQLTDVRVVATSLTVSITDVTLNLIVAIITGSTVMLSQALQGFSDLITGGVLYIGVRRSKRTADMDYQFGYGREIFFWVLLAGIFMFMGTGGLSLLFGYRQFVNPDGIENLPLAIGTLLFGLFTNGYALSLSIRRLHNIEEKSNWWQQLLKSSIVETKATMLIDFMGTAAAVIGFVTLMTYAATGNARLDGLGSIIIGLSMMAASLLLIRDVRDLIVGRSVDHDITEQIIGATMTVDGVRSVLDLRTMYLGSAKLLVIIEVHVDDGLETDHIEQIVDNVKLVVSRSIPQVEHIQVEIETPDHELLKK
jgi:cation diffusion facilitator family transporter